MTTRRPVSTKGAESAQKALCWRGPSRKSYARNRTKLDSSHSLKLGDSFWNLILTIPGSRQPPTDSPGRCDSFGRQLPPGHVGLRPVLPRLSGRVRIPRQRCHLELERKRTQKVTHLNRDKIESNLSVPRIQGCHENALFKSSETSSHIIRPDPDAGPKGILVLT